MDFPSRASSKIKNYHFARLVVFVATVLSAVLGAWLYAAPSESALIVGVVMFLYFIAFAVVFYLFGDPFHPVLFGGVGIFLYASWDPFFSLIRGLALGVCDFQAFGLASLALSAFMLSSIFFSQKVPRVGAHGYAFFSSRESGRHGLLFWVLVVGVTAATAGAWYSGYASSVTEKRDIDHVTGLGYLLRFVLAFLLFYTVLTVGKVSRKHASAVLAIGLFFGMSMLFLLGERNYIVMFFMAVLFAKFHFSAELGKRNIFFLFLFILILLPLSQGVKGLFSWGGYGGLEVYQGLATFHAQEFRAGGRNLANLLCLLSAGDYPGLHLRDIGRFFYFNNSGSHQFINHQIGWGGMGRGFSLVGQQWLVGGWAAVVSFYVVAGLLIGSLYRVMHRGTFFAVLYLFFTLGFVYAQRADLANWLAFGIKTGLIPLLFASFLLRMKVGHAKVES